MSDKINFEAAFPRVHYFVFQRLRPVNAVTFYLKVLQLLLTKIIKLTRNILDTFFNENSTEFIKTNIPMYQELYQDKALLGRGFIISVLALKSITLIYRSDEDTRSALRYLIVLNL